MFSQSWYIRNTLDVLPTILQHKRTRSEMDVSRLLQALGERRELPMLIKMSFRSWQKRDVRERKIALVIFRELR
jgi:hypothetical protein